MAANDTSRILNAIENLRGDQQKSLEAIAALNANVANISQAVRDLGTKVDRMESDKVSRSELNGTETRWEKSLAEVKALSTFEAGRMSQEWTSRLDAIDEKIEAMDMRLRSNEAFTSKIDGMVIATHAGSGIAGGLILWLAQKLLHF